jgi:hypothetical protein
MPSSIETKAASDEKRRTSSRRVNWRTTAYDKVSGFFLTLVLFLGVIVSAMFLLWTLSRWAMQDEIQHSRPLRTEFVEGPEPGSENDFEVPSEAEVAELMQPSLQETLTAVEAAAGEAALSLAELPYGVSEQKVSGTGHSGPGNRPPDESQSIIPRFERWQINFSATDQHHYLSQLDFLNIELGVLGGETQGIDYLRNLSTHPTRHHSPESKAEKRLYFMWTSDSPLRFYEVAVLQEAGIEIKDRQLLKFLPAELENNLATIELQYAEAAGHGSVTEIAKTVFQCVEDGDDYALEVVNQRYRNRLSE